MKSFKPEQFLILVVDDTIQNLQLVVTMLDGVGYGTTFATGGQEALERLKNVKPNLILLDLMMPEMSGLEVCQYLQSQPEYRDIPIIFLTASQEQEDLLTAFEQGAVDYITKPFNQLELLARVKTHLELKQTQDELKKALEEVQKLARELEKLATTDPLTGIANRRQILMLGEKELSDAWRYKRPLSVLMLDLDHFKRINDNYGHPVGDQVLKSITETANKNLRLGDAFGRFGGEEFVAFLPETNTKEAMIVAERIRSTITAISVTNLENNHTISNLTVSIGVATLQATDKNLEHFLSRADDALYEAKKQGRNRVAVHPVDLAVIHDSVKK